MDDGEIQAARRRGADLGKMAGDGRGDGDGPGTVGGGGGA